MRRIIATLAGSLLCAGAAIAIAAPSSAPMDEAALETGLDAAIHPDELRAWMKTMTAEPNQVGSAHDKLNAEFELAKFKEWGWDAHIETFEVLYPTPISEVIETKGAHPWKATLQEPPVPGDAESYDQKDALPAYVAYQGDGDVTAPLVYVNYGTQEDYKTLERLGISVKGKIAIARYGSVWRGLKPKLAQDHGAIGCIIYSDPHDDGYATDDVFPKGPARPSFGFQRGSVADMPIYPGDPLTPGVGATKDAHRIKREDAATILKIPVLPISYGDARVLLGAMTGPVAPAAWRGSLAITYHVGPGPKPVHLAVKSDWSLKTLYDVIAMIPGSVWPDQWVVRGNHHDGWVRGASDPLSGQVALMAEAKALGGFLKQGWRPKRTIVYTSWDGEEPMLLGSTEWAETHEAELKKKAVLYINSDGNGRGLLRVEGSHDFQHAVNDVANDVTDPETNVPVGVRARAYIRVMGDAPGANEHAKGLAKLLADPDKEIPFEPLGSGSDYSSFIDHVGTAAINLGFGGEGSSGGVYHSLYDDFYHHSHFVDPGFVYDAMLAKVTGRIVLRVADSTLPVQRASDFADAVAGYLTEVKKLADTRREEAATQASLLKDGDFKLAADPTKSFGEPTALLAVPKFDFAPMDKAVERLKKSAAAYDAALAKTGPTLPPADLARLQGLMLDIDGTLLSAEGLPGRPWYRNLVYAPGRFAGYGAKTLPGIREGIEDQRFDDASHFIGATATVLDAYSDRLDEATKVLGG